MKKKHVTENHFLGLESCSTVDDVLGSIGDANIAWNVQDMAPNCTFHIEEETHENKNTSHSGCKTCSIYLDSEWKSLIVKHVKSCKKCRDFEFVERKKRF